MKLGIGRFSAFVFVLFLYTAGVFAQSNSGSIEGVVKDPSGGAVVNATVEFTNVVSGLVRTTSTGGDGTFRFTNIPCNPYHMTVTATGFAPYTPDVEVLSGLPARLMSTAKSEPR